MPSDANQEPDDPRTNRRRYRFIEYDDDGHAVSIIQDAENHNAWIQSTLTVDIER